MGQNGTDVDFLSVVMDSSNQSNFVATDVEDGEFSNLIGGGEGIPKFWKGGEVILPNDGVPLDESICRLWVAGGKFVEAFSRNHMHVKDFPPVFAVVLIPRCGVARRGR